ncbi:MAG: uroporphyrinogen-III C-methyltransferase [Brucellaceae bacterium]|nr:uroporphyrinogen-III C-methyltransferase [Brucellaceae bacterium]
MSGIGKVYLIGAGPGDPDLLTLKAARLIGKADVVVHDRLVSGAVLDMVPRTAARLSVGKEPNRHPVPQHEINRLLVKLARGGLTVVRLKGGDPFIFGRGGEEAMELAREGIPFDVVPGITAAQGCAASALVPLTHRGTATSLRFVTGHCRDNEPLDLDWAGLADPATTLVVYMGCAQIAIIATELIARKRSAATPVVAVSGGTTPTEKVLRSTLGAIAADMRSAGMSNPVVFYIGEAAAIDLRPADAASVPLRLVEPAFEAAHG